MRLAFAAFLACLLCIGGCVALMRIIEWPEIEAGKRRAATRPVEKLVDPYATLN